MSRRQQEIIELIERGNRLVDCCSELANDDWFLVESSEDESLEQDNVSELTAVAIEHSPLVVALRDFMRQLRLNKEHPSHCKGNQFNLLVFSEFESKIIEHIVNEGFSVIATNLLMFASLASKRVFPTFKEIGLVLSNLPCHLDPDLLIEFCEQQAPGFLGDTIGGREFFGADLSVIEGSLFDMDQRGQLYRLACRLRVGGEGLDSFPTLRDRLLKLKNTDSAKLLLKKLKRVNKKLSAGLFMDLRNSLRDKVQEMKEKKLISGSAFKESVGLDKIHAFKEKADDLEKRLKIKTGDLRFERDLLSGRLRTASREREERLEALSAISATLFGASGRHRSTAPADVAGRVGYGDLGLAENRLPRRNAQRMFGGGNAIARAREIFSSNTRSDL